MMAMHAMVRRVFLLVHMPHMVRAFSPLGCKSLLCKPYKKYNLESDHCYCKHTRRQLSAYIMMPIARQVCKSCHSSRYCTWRSAAQRSAAQHSAAQHSTAQHSTAQRSTACRDIAWLGIVWLGKHAQQIDTWNRLQTGVAM